MKNEIGEYGRTNFGRIIDKFAFLTHQNGEINTNKVILIKDNKLTRDFYYFEKGEYMLKHSPNLIDIIEEGDYVNGEIVIKIFNPRFLSFGELPYIITANYNNKYEPQEIEEIVTKERFEDISYKVKE